MTAVIDNIEGAFQALLQHATMGHLFPNDYAGGCDKTAKMWNPGNEPEHGGGGGTTAPIRHLFAVKDMSGMLVTGGWDKTLRYWDLRQPNPAARAAAARARLRHGRAIPARRRRSGQPAHPGACAQVSSLCMHGCVPELQGPPDKVGGCAAPDCPPCPCTAAS